MRASVRLVGRARVVFAILAATLVCAGGASAASGWSEVTIAASDATPLACAYIIPSGTAPAGGWPGVILFHGLGQSRTDMEPYGSALAQFGFAALACDARGTGGSGGKFGLDGPNEVQDAQDLFTWFAGRNNVSDTQIGAFGLSLGGGEVLNAAVAGVPFKAIVPAITWTSLGAALNPSGVPKVELLSELFQSVPSSQWDSSLTQTRTDLLSGNVTAAVKTAEATRSSRSKLHLLHAPTFLLQGRHDFLFDMDQAIAAYKLLPGPKRLYLGDIGHAPAKNPSAEEPTYLAEVLGWFDEYLAGGPKLGGGVQLGHDPWDGATTSYAGLPRIRHKVVNLPGTTKLTAPGASTSRSVRLTGGPLEAFGDGFITVRYSGASSSWTQLVATVAVKGTSTPVTFGSARVTKPSGVLKIPLSNQAVLLPRGKRLVVAIGGQTADGVYAQAGGGSITIRRVTLNLSLLRRAVSK
jgi:ABC-2 type transport system ATP-binding protein